MSRFSLFYDDEAQELLEAIVNRNYSPVSTLGFVKKSHGSSVTVKLSPDKNTTIRMPNGMSHVFSKDDNVDIVNVMTFKSFVDLPVPYSLREGLFKAEAYGKLMETDLAWRSHTFANKFVFGPLSIECYHNEHGGRFFRLMQEFTAFTIENPE